MRENDDMSAVSVKAPNGTYVGSQMSGVSEFRGIPYAESPRRWRIASPLKSTVDDVIVASGWGDACVQPDDETEYASRWTQSEDCLTLNVWSRNLAQSDKPVMVFIHGGGGVSGGSVDPLYRGRNLAEHVSDDDGIVVVSINYRLGMFGTLNLERAKGFTDEYREGLNLWLRDQQEALRWVQRNIQAFGGDRSNVTVFGQSAGAGFISTHLTIPESRALFARAIIQSGPIANRQMTLERSFDVSESVFRSLGVRDLDSLVSLPASEIKRRGMPPGSPAFGGSVFFPVTDSSFIPEDGWNLLHNGAARDIDLLIGTTDGERDTIAVDAADVWPPTLVGPEAVLETITRYESAVAGASTSLLVSRHPGIIRDYLASGDEPTRALVDLCNDINYGLGAELMAQAQARWNQNTYLYKWCWAPSPANVLEGSPGSASLSPFGRALHCEELPFVLRNTDAFISISGTDLPALLVDQASDAWVSFARNGQPVAPGAPEWRGYDRLNRATMVIDQEWRVDIDSDSAYRRRLAPIIPAGMG